MYRRFSEWLDLRESVDIRVVGAHYAQPTSTILDLAHILVQKVVGQFEKQLSPEERKSLRYDTFTNDGDDFHKATGVINFYVGDLSPEHIEKMTKAAIYYLGDLGAKVGKITTNTHSDRMEKDIEQIRQWGDDDPNDPDMDWSDDYPPRTVKQKIDDYLKQQAPKDPNKIRVVRIPVIARTGQGEQNPPERNLSDESGRILFMDLLNFGSNYLGKQFSARDILFKLGQLTDFQIQKAVQDPSQSNFGKATHINVGYDEERIRRMINDLEEICQWAVQNHYDYIVVV